jgi:hypothetical protein
VVVTIDGAASAAIERADRKRQGEHVVAPDPAVEELRAQRSRALRHALAEYELRVHQVVPGTSLVEALGR